MKLNKHNKTHCSSEIECMVEVMAWLKLTMQMASELEYIVELCHMDEFGDMTDITKLCKLGTHKQNLVIWLKLIKHIWH